MNKEIDKCIVLDRIKSIYDLKSDLELAKFLKIPPSTLSSWRQRNSLDMDVIHSICVDINWNYLIRGIGDPFTNGGDAAISQVTKIKMESLVEENKTLRQYLKSVQNAADTKDKLIEMLQGEIDRLINGVVRSNNKRDYG